MRIIPLPLHRQAAGRGAPGSRLYGHNRGGGGQIWYLLVVDMPSRPDLFPRHLRIGPYLRTVAANAKWRTADEFPSCQEWADEVEKVLAFLDSQDQFERFLPRCPPERANETARSRKLLWDSSSHAMVSEYSDGSP